MTIAQAPSQQATLRQDQIEAFHVDCFANSQVKHFLELTKDICLPSKCVVADIGGGIGYFAQELNAKTALRVRVVDSDKRSVDICNNRRLNDIEAVVGDALEPVAVGDEEVVCFNFVLHHLVGTNERENERLQRRALTAWRDHSKYLFINEYIYDSYVKNLSGRLIYEITSGKILSKMASLLSKFVPSFRANTFGVGVRFRGHREWIELFERCGYEVVGMVRGEKDYVAAPLRLLMISRVSKNSYLLRCK